ncbi:hypothetical protein C3L33_06084, partial [Rhododendron williamsianum]
MSSSISIPLSPTTHTQPFLKPRENNLLFGGSLLPKRLPFPKRRVSYTATRALLSANKESVLHDFHERRALKIITGLQNFCRDNVASVVIAADKTWNNDHLVSEKCSKRWCLHITEMTGSDSTDMTNLAISVFQHLLLIIHVRDTDAYYSYFCLSSVELLTFMPFAFALLHWCLFVSVSCTSIKQGGATHVDIACDPELVKLATSLTSLPVNPLIETSICVSSVTPAAFPAAVEAGAVMVEIGNYDSFYEMGVLFSPEQIKLAEQLEQEGVDIIQTEGGKCSNATNAGVLGLIEKATPTLASAYSISRAVKIPVMCSSGLSAVTAPMAITAGAAGVGVGSAINKLNDVVAMIAEVRSIADSLGISSDRQTVVEEKALRL